jgi:hypothetical protein
MPDSTDNARGPERIWIDPHGGNWSGREGGTQEVEYTRADLTPDPLRAVKIKLLEWEDADEGMCTKWRAPALGGSYDLVSFEGEEGFAVNFCWGRPLSYWFIQGAPDQFGPTGPKMFHTLEAAKAAAQQDYESRIRSALEPDPLADARVQALVDALKRAEQNFYEAANRFRDEDYEGPISGLTVNAVCHAKPYFDKHMQHLDDSAAEARAALAAFDKGGKDE